ncbi:beta strand repeat-containing protein [Acinetobacter modestus]|uniref:beta strand repeat-containing protein n=1 Tax=Acinetobacter modestus TaxID=1776740 RepID=UPI001F4B5D82|nr:hypothetical protein [Acinetobacter modestus]MCH7328763.1 hypothetical protein [Acinetobacter modestus]
MLFKSLLSPIKSITSNLLESNTTTSSITGSTLAPLSLSSITNIVSTSSITNTVNQTISTVSNSIASSPISTITSTLGSVTGSSSPLSTVTNIVSGVTGGTTTNPVDTVTNIVGGITGGIGTSPLNVVTNILGATGSNPVNIVTGIIGGVTGGDLSNNPVTSTVQNTIDTLQGVESLKTSIINSGIHTVADAVIGTVHQSEHPIGDLANLGTLTFETSRDTVNGSLEAVSNLAGADINGAIGSATGVIGTLINNGSTASNTVQHIVGDLTDISSGSPVAAVTDIIGGVTGGGVANPLDAVTNIIGGITSGVGGNPLDAVTDIIGGITGGVGGNPLETVTDLIGGVTGGLGSNPLETVTDLIGGVTGSVGGNPLDAVTNIIGGVTGGVGGNPLETVTDLIGGITGGVSGNPLDAVTGIIGGITGGVSGNPLDAVTDIIGGVTGGDLGNNPVTGIVQTGIDVLQGVESLKTEIINTGINTVGGVISGVLPQVHPIVDLTNLGTLTFETSRDTVNGTLEAISDLAGADINGAVGSASGVIGTLINNGTTASNTIQHIVGDLTDLGSSNPLGNITDIIGGITGGIGGNPLEAVTGIIGGITGGVGGNPLDAVTDIIGGVTGGVGGNPLEAVTGIIGGVTGGVGGNPLDAVTGIIGGVTGGVGGNPLDAVTGIIGGITGGDLANNPITGAIQTGIDILQGVESLKTEIINTGINTVADTIISAVPQVEHPVGDLADLGTLSFETSRDTVNGTLEAISDLSGGDLSGVLESATGVVGTLINNSSSAADILQHITNDFAFGNPLDIATGVIDGITGSISGSPLGSISEIITNIGNGFDSGDVISGIAQPIQTGITNANLAIDTLQDNLTNLASDSTFETIDSLINVNLGGGDYHISGSVDSILNAITGTVSSTIAVGEPNPNGGSVTDLISLPSQLTSLTDNLFSSINHF